MKSQSQEEARTPSVKYKEVKEIMGIWKRNAYGQID
jgi:hypothetical protein